MQSRYVDESDNTMTHSRKKERAKGKAMGSQGREKGIDVVGLQDGIAQVL